MEKATKKALSLATIAIAATIVIVFLGLFVSTQLSHAAAPSAHFTVSDGEVNGHWEGLWILGMGQYYVDVTVTVTNDGDAAGIGTVYVQITQNGNTLVPQQQQVTLQAGQVQTLSFRFTGLQPSKCELGYWAQ